MVRQAGFAFAVALALALPAQAAASEITVDTLLDEPASGPGLCDLRSAITASVNDVSDDACPAGDGADEIEIEVTGMMHLGGPLPELSGELEIDGPGMNDLTVRRNSGGDYRILTIASSSEIFMHGFTIANGLASGTGVAQGGGIDNRGLTVLHEVAVNNNAVTAGGNSGFVNGRGGGINNQSDGDLTLIDSVVGNNFVTVQTSATGNSHGSGGGISSEGPLTLERTEVRGNQIDSDSENSASFAGAGVASVDDTLIDSSAVLSNFGDAAASAGIGNAFGSGAGIAHSANFGHQELTLENSTVAFNDGEAIASGTGVAGASSSGLRLSIGAGQVRSSTIARNSVAASGGSGQQLFSANIEMNSPGQTLTFENTVVALAVGSPNNCGFGGQDAVSLGFNLEDDNDPGGDCGFQETSDQSNVNPQLNIPAFNGGPTRTMKPDLTSPLLDRGISTGADSDQRGELRRRDLEGVTTADGSDGTDIGAFEVNSTSVEPRDIEFGQVDQGATSGSEVVEVSNVYGSTFNLESASIAGPDAGLFEILFEDCSGEPLLDTDVCFIEVRFAPGATAPGGSAEAVLLISDDIANSFQVELSGAVNDISVPAATIDAVTLSKQTTGKKGKKKTTHTAAASFRANEAGTFRCRLDAAALAPCTSPQSYASLQPGAHTFAVVPTDSAGNVGDEVTSSFTVPKAKKPKKKKKKGKKK